MRRVDLRPRPAGASPQPDQGLRALSPELRSGLSAPQIVGAEIGHLKTAANVVEVMSACTVRVVIAGGAGTLTAFTNGTILLRATSRTTYAGGAAEGATALGGLGLKPGDVFTLSFDSRPYPTAATR
jgi:hypothetical protein